jgi:hypothetical protein
MIGTWRRSIMEPKKMNERKKSLIKCWGKLIQSVCEKR